MDRARILIVDDELIMRESLAGWLERDGYEVGKAANGAEALEQLNASRFDILLVDVKMEGISGLDILKKVRKSHPDIAVVMITAYVSIATAVEAMKSRAYDYLLKPFDPVDLSLLIQKVLQNPAGSGRECLLRDNTLKTEGKGEGKTKEKIKMMLVDDEKRFLSSTAKLLAKRGYDVETASSGAEAVEKLKHQNIDVVVLDVALPEMDGIETLIAVKRLFPMVEVIMLTGYATVESAVESLKYGATDYLMKPVDIKDFIRKIEEIFDK